MKKKINRFLYLVKGYNILKSLIILDLTIFLLIGISTSAICHKFNCKSAFDFFILAIGGGTIHNKMISISKISWLFIFILNAYYFGMYMEQEFSGRFNTVIIRFRNTLKYVNYNLKVIITITSIHLLMIYSILMLICKISNMSYTIKSNILKNIIGSHLSDYNPHTLVYMICFYALSCIVFSLIQLLLTLKLQNTKIATLIVSCYCIFLGINSIGNYIFCKFAIGNCSIITRTNLICTHVPESNVKWLLFYNTVLILIFYCLNINVLKNKGISCTNK